MADLPKNSSKTQEAYIKIVALLYMISFIHLAAGTCQEHTIDGQGLKHVKCKCSSEDNDLEITPELSTNFINASSVEISHCRNVTLHSNLFRTAYDLHALSISQVDSLSFDPALSLPVALQTFSLSHIGYLNHFPVPGPSSALLHSVRSLKSFSLEDVTVVDPRIHQSTNPPSTFIDLPITMVHLKDVKFVGTIPKGMLQFNSSSLAHFSAEKCHFSDMVEGSFIVRANGNVTIEDCKFERMVPESMTVYGQCVMFRNNTFQFLSGTHTTSIEAELHVAILKNHFQALGGPHALFLSANDNAFVEIKENQLPCGCYALNFIPATSKKVNASDCTSNDSLACALLQKQYCLHASGKHETIVISKPDSPSCPGSVASGSAISQLWFIPCIIFYTAHLIN